LLLVGFQIADVPCLGEGSFPFFVITLLAMQVRIPEEEELDEELEDELNNPGLEKPEEEVTPKVSSRGAGGDEGTPDDVSKNSPEEEEEELDEEVETVLNNLNALILPLPKIPLVALVRAPVLFFPALNLAHLFWINILKNCAKQSRDNFGCVCLKNRHERDHFLAY